MTTGTTLADRLTQIRETFESGSTPSHIVNVLNAHVDWLVENSVEDRALKACLLYTSPSPRDRQKSRMPSSA